MTEYTVTESSKFRFLVENDEGAEYYVRLGLDGKWRCSCLSFLFYGRECKHILMCKEYLVNRRRG